MCCSALLLVSVRTQFVEASSCRKSPLALACALYLLCWDAGLLLDLGKDGAGCVRITSVCVRVVLEPLCLAAHVTSYLHRCQVLTHRHCWYMLVSFITAVTLVATSMPAANIGSDTQNKYSKQVLGPMLPAGVDVESDTCFDAASWAQAFREQSGFRVFSQGYQDSVLRSLFTHIGTKNKEYVEFGFHVADVKGTANFSSVQRRHPSVRELPSYGANSELLQRHGWSGLRFDGDESNHILVPNLRQAFITPQNVVALFRQHNVSLDVDYVSIDVDSCDLWIFLALTDVYRPTVVTVEYNSNYAFNESFTNVCTSPEDDKFFTSTKFTQGHWGWSASLAAINKAANRRGYAVVWVEPMLDVFLVRLDKLCQPHGIPPLQQFEFATGLPLHAGKTPKQRDGHALFAKWIAEYH